MNDTTTTRMFLTTAVLAAVAALIAGPAHAVNLDVEGGSGAAVPAPIGPGTIPSGEATLGLTGDSALTRQGELSSQQSPRLTGVHAALQRDRRVAHTMPEGLTGDSALTRTDLSSPSATAQASSSGGDNDWTWIGLGAGMAALLAAAGAGLYFSARHRGRIALP